LWFCAHATRTKDFSGFIQAEFEKVLNKIMRLDMMDFEINCISHYLRLIGVAIKKELL
jgi:hypothetical protein